nr:hypothetical protein GZ18F2_8 [uncultured archaeon GZfos18F2]
MGESHHLSRKKFAHRPIEKFFFYHVGSTLQLMIIFFKVPKTALVQLNRYCI